MNCSSGKEINFFTAVNEAYYNYALALESSLRINTGMRITIFTINFTITDKPNRVPLIVPIEQRFIGKFSHEAATCMRMRASIFPDIIAALSVIKVKSMIMWVDADSLVRKPIDGLIAHIQDCHITAKQKGPNEYASGVLGIDTDSIEFARFYEALVEDDEHWKSDQRNLAETIRIFNSEGFKPLPEIYCDTGFTNEGVIWTAKIKCHEDPKWKKEYEYYLSR